MKKKVIFLSILFALLEIIFPVSSGVLGSLMHLEGSKMILLQALFMGASTILFFIIILKKVDRNGRFMGIKCLFKKKNLPLLLTFLLFLPLVLGQKTSSSALTIWASFGLYLMVGISEELVFRILIPSILGKEFKTKGIIVR